MTLIEIMVAFTLFAIMASGVAATLVQMRKEAESNISQATAQVIAQGIVEQLQFVPYNALCNASSVDLKLIGVSSGNLADIQTFTVTWASDATYTAIGEVSGGVTKGVVLDADYKSGSTTIRPKRYMKMNVNLQRSVDIVNGNASVILSYQWQLPDRNIGAPVFITKEIRVIRSQAPSY